MDDFIEKVEHKKACFKIASNTIEQPPSSPELASGDHFAIPEIKIVALSNLFSINQEHRTELLDEIGGL